MQLHQLKPTHKFKNKKRVGRGGKRGTYSGRGIKGQSSRSGRKYQPIIRELIKRYPKLRGHKEKGMEMRRDETAVVNLDVLEKKFNSGDKINPEVLVEKGIIGRIKGKFPRVKILGGGELTKRFIIENCEFSKSAKKKYELASKNSSDI